MSAIEFVVRDSAGQIEHGNVAGDGAAASIIVSVDEDISLNLSRAQVQSYSRQGQALQVVLIDGRVIMIEGFFTPEVSLKTTSTSRLAGFWRRSNWPK